MRHKYQNKKPLLQNIKYLNTCKVCIDSWWHCEITILFCGLYLSISVPSLCTFFFLVDLSPLYKYKVQARHCTFYFFTKVSFFIKRGGHFQVLGCGFVTNLCSVLWKLLHGWMFLAICSFIDRYFNVVLGMWVQLCAF